MQQKELQQLTASEPLSLKEEYEMQASWHLDKNKLIFIIMDKEKWLFQQHSILTETNEDTGTNFDSILEKKSNKSSVKDSIDENDCMIGDTCGSEMSKSRIRKFIFFRRIYQYISKKQTYFISTTAVISSYTYCIIA